MQSSHCKQYTLLTQINTSYQYHLQKTEEAQQTKRIESINMPLSSALVTGKRTGAIFPGSNGKVGAPCQIPSNCFMLLQPLLLLLLLLCPLQLSCSSPSLSSVSSSTVPGPSSQRIGAKLPPFLGSKGTLTPRTGRSPPAVATPTSSPLAPPPYSRCSCCSV